MLLAIDTSTSQASIALFHDTVLAESSWQAGREQTRDLLPEIQHLLALVGAKVNDLTALGVALGPGGFNGLRVGLATAKAIATADGLPIVGIETPRADAYQHRLTFRPIRPLYDAGRGEVATGLYKAADELFGTLEEPRITTLDEVLSASPPDTLFCGELRSEWCQKIQERFGPDGHVVRPAGAVRRAGFLAELAAQLVDAGLVDNPATLQPIYLRRPPIHGGARQVGRTAQ